MRLVALPTVYDTTDHELLELGIGEQQAEPGVIYINPEMIATINMASDENESTIGINNTLLRICMPIDKLIKLIRAEVL